MSFPFAGTHSATEWADWYRTNTDIVEDGVQIATDPYPSYEAPRPIGDGEFDAVDVTVDGCGTAYILSTDGNVYRYDSDLERLSRLDCVWDPEDGGEPSAIAVTKDTLYVADRATGRVQALSVHLLQTRWITSGFSNPIALTVSEGTVYLLDVLNEATSSGAVEGQLRRLSPRGEVQTVVEHEYSPTDLATDDAGNVVVLGPETDTVIDLFEPATLAASGGDATPDIRVPTDSFPVTSRGPTRPPISVEAVGVAELLVGIGSAKPDETGLFRYRPDEGEFEPMPGIDGSVVELQTGNPGRDGTDPPLYLIDGKERDVRMLAAAGRTRRVIADGDYRADLVGRFDSGEHGMQWHRVTLGLDRGDTRARTKTQVRLQYAATDDDWQPAGGDVDPADPPGAIEGIGPAYSSRLQAAGLTELRDIVAMSPGRLALVLRTDSHQISLRAAADILASARAALRGEGVDISRIGWHDLERPNPEDALIPDAEGRYLWLKLTLIGDQGASPHVDSVRAYFPRQSYLRHLPAVYREEATSAAFLERYLSIFESTFVDVEEQIASSSKYIDPGGIPTEHLQWLGEWLAVEADETWSADALQALIEAAPALYRKRGTAEGLLATIRLYLRHSDAGVMPRGPVDLVTDGNGASFSPQRDGKRDEKTDRKAVYLIEHGDLSCIDCREVRRLYDRLISCSRGFLVLLHPDVTDTAAETIGRIVEAQQPAHATGRTVHLRDTTVLNGTGKEEAGARGHHTYLGVNSRLSSREFKLGESVMGQDSRLGAREPDGQLELQSRLGEDSRLS